jgi:hypothetical protein
MTGLSILAGLLLITCIVYIDEDKHVKGVSVDPRSLREADEAVEWTKNYLAGSEV